MKKLKKIRVQGLVFLALLICTLLAACGGKKDGNRRVPTGKDDLRGAVIGVQLGTTSDGFASELEKTRGDTKVVRFNKGADAVQALNQGKIDCVLTDEAPALAFQRKNPSLGILPEPVNEAEFAICVAKGNEALLSAINGALDQLKANGTIDSIIKRNSAGGILVPRTSSYKEESMSSEDVLRTMGKKKKLRFITNATFEPFEFYKDGRIVGIDVDVAHAIGEELGMEIEIRDVEFDAIITSVQAGKADAGIAGITITPERKKNIDFTQTYSKVRQVILVNKGGKVAESQAGIVEKFQACFVDDARYLYLLTGLGNTLTITFFAIILSVFLGTLIAIIRATYERTGKLRALNAVCQLYLTVVRGTPTMVQLLIIYYVVFASVDVNKIVVAVIAFGLNSAAYIAEVVRSGIMSVDNGQMEAGRSLGLSYGKTMRLVILPQAFKNVLPAMGNELITLLKETSISGYIGLVDLTKGSDIIRSVTYEAMLPLGMVALIYLLIVVLLYMGVRRMEKRLRKGERK